MNKVLLILLAVIFCACEQPTKPKNHVYFAGEIVNPTSDYVVLYRKDKIVDSAKIDASNHFVFNLEEIDEGLHHFDHSPELQYVYLEEGDSILVRLNTVAFDESLVFSGTNDEVNNFLIEMFLNYEDEEMYVYSLYKLSPQEFTLKIDSLRNQKIEELENLTNRTQLSEKAGNMAKAAVDYASFVYKEKYPFYHKKYTGEETIHDLKDDFYSHRQFLSTNTDELVYFRPYYDYMKYHLGNLSYKECSRKCEDKFNSANSFILLNKQKINLIDSLVNHEELKNNLYRSVAMDVLLSEHPTNKECDDFIEDFKKRSTNEAHHHEIVDLYSGIKKLQPNNPLPDLELVSFEGNLSNLKSIAKNSHTVFYFWSAVQKRHLKSVLAQVNKLKETHPNTNFVGISLMTTKEQWQAMIKEHQLNEQQQFWAMDMQEARNKLVIDGLNKCIIVKDTLIENGFANLYTSL